MENIVPQENNLNNEKPVGKSTLKGWNPTFNFVTKSASWTKYESEFKISLRDSILVLLTVFIIPLTINLLAAYAVKSDDNGRKALLQLLNIAVIGVVTFYLLAKYKSAIFRDGSIALLYFRFGLDVVFLVLTFAGLFENTYAKGTPEYTTREDQVNMISMAAQTIIELTFVGLVFGMSPLIRQQYKDMFQVNNLWKTIIILSIGLATSFGLVFLFDLIQSAIPGGNSNSANEESLDKLYKTTGGAIILGLSTILAAPLMEEMAMRHGVFRFAPNKYVAAIFAFLFFASMHVEARGDFVHIFSYLGVSGACTLAYFFTDAIVVSWGIHMISNIVAFSSFYIIGS